MREGEATEATVNAAREGYRAPPSRAACFWFVVADLRRLSPMYEPSLVAFKAMYVHCIGAAAAAFASGGTAGGGGGGSGSEAILHARLTALRDWLTVHIHSTVGFVEIDPRLPGNPA